MENISNGGADEGVGLPGAAALFAIEDIGLGVLAWPFRSNLFHQILNGFHIHCPIGILLCRQGDNLTGEILCHSPIFAADRIGGLSSANGIVFGRIAGASATQAALDAPETPLKTDIALPQRGLAKADAERLARSLKHTMSSYCMINRTETGLSEALHELEGLKTEATTLSTQKAQDSEVAALARLQSQIQLAQEMVKAMRKRTESLGSHYRAD